MPPKRKRATRSRLLGGLPGVAMRLRAIEFPLPRNAVALWQMHPTVRADHHHLRLRGSRFTLNWPLRTAFQHPPDNADESYQKQVFHSGPQRMGNPTFGDISANARFQIPARYAKHLGADAKISKNILKFSRLSEQTGLKTSVRSLAQIPVPGGRPPSAENRRFFDVDRSRR